MALLLTEQCLCAGILLTQNTFPEDSDVKKVSEWLLILVNICACFCLVYFGYLFLSGNTTVDYPDAMLPMERWERGGSALTIGMIPLMTVNTAAYKLIQTGTKKSRLPFFIPSVVCIGLVACYWIKSLS